MHRREKKKIKLLAPPRLPSLTHDQSLPTKKYALKIVSLHVGQESEDGGSTLAVSSTMARTLEVFYGHADQSPDRSSIPNVWQSHQEL